MKCIFRKIQCFAKKNHSLAENKISQDFEEYQLTMMELPALPFGDDDLEKRGSLGGHDKSEQQDC